MEEIEQVGVELMNFSGSVVTQITVEARHGFRIVAFAIAVNDVQSLSSMCVEEMQPVRTVRDLNLWLDSAGKLSKEDQRQ